MMRGWPGRAGCCEKTPWSEVMGKMGKMGRMRSLDARDTTPISSRASGPDVAKHCSSKLIIDH
jgi:hypothetical protein